MAIVLRRVATKRPRSIEMMAQMLQAEWLAFPREQLERMYDSMPERLKQIRKKKGGNTDY